MNLWQLLMSNILSHSGYLNLVLNDLFLVMIIYSFKDLLLDAWGRRYYKVELRAMALFE